MDVSRIMSAQETHQEVLVLDGLVGLAEADDDVLVGSYLIGDWVLLISDPLLDHFNLVEMKTFAVDRF